MPGSKKLGNERTTFYSEALDIDGVLGDTYRNRKLLNYYLETSALKHDLTLRDAHILCALNLSHTFKSRREIADFTGFNYQSVIFSLQKMAAKELVEIEEIKLPKGEKAKNAQKNFRFTLLPESAPIIAELEQALTDYQAARLSGLSDKELDMHKEFNEKIKKNIQNILQ